MNMQRRIMAGIIGIVLLLGGWTASVAAAERDNPIDLAFGDRFDTARSTAEQNYVAEKYLTAWEEELANAALKMKTLYRFDEDKGRVDEYTAAYAKAADAAYMLEWLNWADREVQPPKRSFGTGAPSASMLVKARIYRQATLNLIDRYQGQEGRWSDNNGQYQFIYSGDGGKLPR